MKKFTLMLITVLTTVLAQASEPAKRLFNPEPLSFKHPVAMNVKQAPQGMFKQNARKARTTRRAAASTADLAGTYLWEYETCSDFSDETAERSAGSAYVTITAADESTIILSGMFSNDLTATVDFDQGAIIIEPQTVGTSSYGDYEIYGLFYYEGGEDEPGWYYDNIYGGINEDGSISFDDHWFVRVLSTGDYAGYSLTPYWAAGSTLTPAEKPTPIELPEGVELAEYIMTYTSSNGTATAPAAVAVDGNDVYFQGFSSYIPEALIKGTKEGNTVTFPADQYLGNYSGYDSYLYTEAVFTYDPETESYSAKGEIFSVLGGQYYDQVVTDPVLTKVIEKVAMPATPAISGIRATNYGDVVLFNVPAVDTNGEGLSPSKLFFQFFIDIEKEISPLTFEAGSNYPKLTENMTVIPFGFTENYDFYTDQIYLNMDHSTWNKIGIKSIYTGGGVTNETEIQWYTIKAYAIDVARDALNAEITTANNMVTEGMTQGVQEFTAAIADAQAVLNNADATIDELNAAVQALKDAEQAFIAANADPSLVKAIWIASEQGYENAQDIDEFDIDNNIKATVLQNESTTHPKYYTTGTALRLYSGNSLTISAGENVEKITKIMITYSATNYASNIETDVETYSLSGKIGIWEGEATEVTFTRTGSSGHARIQNISVEYTVVGGEEPEPVDLTSYSYSFCQALNGWTTIDADGDGNTWSVLTDNTILGHDGKAGLVTSASYANKALTPDNYLVSPKMKLDGKITFWANAQDASYPAEHFGVAVSTASATDAADFQMVTEEWEMSAARRRAQGNWYEFTCDLSAFKGQEGYVAIRHFNCTDMFRLNVDDITLETSQLIDPYDEALEQEIPEPELVVLPEGVETEEYSMTYTDGDGKEASKPIIVAVDGNDVYFQGMSQYLPEAWVKGTMDGVNVTFAANQYMGEYGSYGSSYFFYDNDVVFTYDAEAETYSATGQIFGVLADQYYDGNYFDPVLQKVTEVAATPATPLIAGIEETNYGDVIVFNIPTTDVDGNGMITSKLFYQFFIDDEDTPLTFTTQYFSKLTENMTVIPYGFTEDYDFFSEYIYLNMPHDTWQKVGIQSIYTGGGVENKSEIFWFEMPVKEQPVEAPVDLATETYSFNANAIEYGKEEEGANPYNIQVQVGFDGDDLYIQGLAADMPELWVKATKNEAGQYVVPANQYMGEFSFYGYTFPYYWTAFDADSTCVDAVFDFDAETSTITSTQTMALNGSAETLDYYLTFTDVVISKLNDVAATPADPTLEEINFEDNYPSIYMHIPTVDTEGNNLLIDKLFYTIYFEKNGVQQPYTFTAALYGEDFEEDVTEVPYSHDGYDIYKGGEIVYFEESYDELQTWTKVGVQSIYYGGGEVNKSNIVWLVNPLTTGISSINVDDSNARYFDLQGRTAQKAQKGLLIKQVRDAEGNVTTVKVVRK
jgi:hypothetical protein